MDDETRRVGEIEAEIVETRVELAETIEAIQDRLTPSHLVANAGESVRRAATEKVRQMTDNSFMDTVRANPIPAAMIGIGAAWLYFKGRSDSQYDRDWSRRPYSGNFPNTPGLYGETADTGRYPVGTGGRAYGSVADSEEGIGERISEMGSDVASRARDVADDVRDTARRTTRQAQLKFNDVLRDSPLMLGAAAALVGAAIGMAIPETQAENQLMGEARDAVVDRAQNLASDAANKVGQVAESVQNAAGKVADTAQDVASSSSSTSSPGSTSTSTSSSGIGGPASARRRTPTTTRS